MAASLSKRERDEFYQESFVHVVTRMRKDQTVLPSSSNSLPRLSLTESTSSPTRLQFFVRMLSERTLVVQAYSNDTIKTIHEKIQSITGIPVIEQRLIYRGRQLQWEDNLGECGVQNDAGLQLVGRMRSTGHPEAWQLMDDIVSMIWCLYKNDSAILPPHLVNSKSIKSMLEEFLAMTPDSNQAASHLQIFVSSSAPAALVMLYRSSHRPYGDIADDAVRHFISSITTVLSKNTYYICASIVLEFCKLLNVSAGTHDPLFALCRSSLAIMVGGEIGKQKDLFGIHGIFQFLEELEAKLSKSLVLGMDFRSCVGPSLTEVHDFTAFMSAARKTIERVPSCSPVKFPLAENGCRNGEAITKLYEIFNNLFKTMADCLQSIDAQLEHFVSYDIRTHVFGWCQYLTILKEMNSISRLYEGVEELFWEKMKQSNNAFCYLILKYAKRTDDHMWILEHKEVTNFETRRHLALMMLPEVKKSFEELHEMLIDRSRLLEESFEYIAHVEPNLLRAGLFMEFKNEVATGPGVLREWFFLVCQAIFNPQNGLFITCPKDRRRFYPNPASEVDPLHLEYFRFSGRMIALALMHKVQVGIVFDRVFFRLLAGKTISLEDIQDADPYLYCSCKQILEMDPQLVDQDVLGLTFVDEVDEMGSRKLVELSTGGKNLAVNSKNRKAYVHSLVQRRFVWSIYAQVAHFAKGFADIISSQKLNLLFFRSLEFEDLDCILQGSESAISVAGWKAHTDYNGYKETDPQISWFWKIVGQMSEEQKRVLLFFWTSIRYLPFEGFGGLESRLFIYKTSESTDHLPCAHTCFNRLCLPAYPSISVMRKRLHVITQEHVGCSFGTG